MSTKILNIFLSKILLCLVVASIFSRNVYSQESGAKVENIYAVYIYNFTKFLDWSNDDSDNFQICIWGKNKIFEPLSIIAEKEKVKGKKIIVKEINDFKNLESCKILFVSKENENQLNDILKKIKGSKTLLVTDLNGFAEKGAGVNFIRTGEKIKFEINKKILEENGIVPSSRLLAIAAKVYD